MKKLSLLLLLCSLIQISNSEAKITCSKPKLNKSTDRKSIYHFKALVSCELVNESINLPTIKDAYLYDIVKKGSQFKVHKQNNYNNSKGMSGYSLDVTQSYNSPNGAVVVRANIVISDDSEKKFHYEFRSKSMTAEGDANYEKSMLNITSFETLPDKTKLIVTKEIDVEKPWYAPESVFFDAVESNLKSSIRASASKNASKICGKHVDVLRK